MFWRGSWGRLLLEQGELSTKPRRPYLSSIPSGQSVLSSIPTPCYLLDLQDQTSVGPARIGQEDRNVEGSQNHGSQIHNRSSPGNGMKHLYKLEH